MGQNWINAFLGFCLIVLYLRQIAHEDSTLRRLDKITRIMKRYLDER